MIRAVAGAAEADGSIVGRLGGDEFSVLLRGCGLAEASEFAAGLQQRLAEVTLKIPQGTIGVTCSIGIAEFQPGDNVDDLMKRADLSLYRSKKEGRNRIASSPLELSLSSGRLRVTRGPLLPRPSLDVRERRVGLATSQELLARVCAIVY
jgi:hypothetical protein